MTSSQNSFAQLDILARRVLEESGALMPGDEAFNTALIEQWLEQLMLRIGAECMEMLPEESLDEYEAIAEDATQEETLQFFQKYIPDFQQKIESVIEAFTIEYLSLSNS